MAKVHLPKMTKGSCYDCGHTGEYAFPPHGAIEMTGCPNCGASPATIIEGDGTQSDNAAAAQAVAKTETPRGQRSPLNIPMNWED